MEKSPPQTALRINSNQSKNIQQYNHHFHQIDLDNIPDQYKHYNNQATFQQKNRFETTQTQFPTQKKDIVIKKTHSDQYKLDLVKFNTHQIDYQRDSGIQQIQFTKQTPVVTFQIKQLKEKQSNSNLDNDNNESLLQTFLEKLASLQTIIKKTIKSDYYRYWYLLILFAFTSSLLIYDFNPNSTNPNLKYNSDAALASFYIQLFCQIFFIFHIIITLIEFKNLEIEWSVLDFIATSCGVIALFLYQQQFDLVTGVTISAKNFLKAVRVMKLLFFVKLSQTIKYPANNVINSLKSVGKILIPALCIIYMYAVVGLYSFSDYEYNRCRPDSTTSFTSNWTVYTDQIYLCGQRTCPTSYSCLNPVDYGIEPNNDQLFQIQLGNSLLTYQNIFYAFLSTLKQVFGTGSSRLIILQKQAIHYLYVLIYYLSFIYLLSYIYLNIFYGLMMSNQQQNIDENQQRNGIIDKIIQKDDTQFMDHTGGFRSTKKQKKMTKRITRIKKLSQRESITKNIFDDHISEINQEQNQKSQKSQKVQKDHTSQSPIQKNYNNTANNNLYEMLSFEERQKDQDEMSIPNEAQIKQQIDPDLIRPLPQKQQKYSQPPQSQKQNSFQIQFIEEQYQKDQIINYEKLYSIFVSINHLTILIGFINLTIDFRDQSSYFQFITDSIDMGVYMAFFIACVIQLAIFAYRLYLFKSTENKSGDFQKSAKTLKSQKFVEDQHQSSANGLKFSQHNSIQYEKNQRKEKQIKLSRFKTFKEETQKQEQIQQHQQAQSQSQKIPNQCINLKPIFPTYLIFQLFLLFLCTAGVIYQFAIADSFNTFLSAETKWAQIFRSIKYLRIILILTSRRYFQQSRVIVISIFVTIYKVRNFIVFWILIMSIFSIMGFHLFAYRTEINPSSGNLDLASGSPFPVSFDGIYNSFVFTMLTFYNQEWDYWMFQQYLGTGAMITIWQILSLFIGLIVMSKYFMALLMKQLGDELDKVQQQSMTEQKRQDKRRRSIKISQQVNGQSKSQSLIVVKQNSVVPLNQSKLKQNLPENVNLSPSGIKQSSNSQNKITSSVLTANNLYKKGSGTNQSKLKNPRRDSIIAYQINLDQIKNDISPNNEINQETNSSNDQQVSFGVTLSFRIVKLCRIIMEHKIYLVIRILMILLSVVELVFSSPQLDQTSATYIVMLIFNDIVVGFFLLQIVITLITYGLFRQKTSYLRKSWINWINLGIIIIQVLSLTILSSNQFFEKFQTIKVLRVLYFIEMRYDADRNMRLTVVGFRRLVPKILTLLTVTFIFYGYFALILVKLYKNDFFYCDGVNLTTSQITLKSGTISQTVSIKTSSQCMLWGGNWIQYRLNAENFFNSLLFSFLSVTTQGWTSLSIPLASLRGTGFQPITNYNSTVWIFTVLFFFFGNMIMLNVFVGLTMNNFKKIKEEVTGQAKLTPAEKEWLSIKKQIYRLQPQILDKPPEHPIRNLCYKIVKSRACNIFKIILFVGFIVSMSLFTTNMSTIYFNSLIIVKFCFVGLQAVFYFLQVLAYGIRSDNLRQFIFETTLLLYASVYGILLITVEVSKENKKIFGGILIAMLFIDYFEILMQFEFVRKMMNSLISILPQTSNLLIIILCTLFIYTIVGMELFSFLKTNNQLNSFDQHYRNFETAIFSLIKFSLMESPIDQLSDAAQTIGPNFVCYDIISYSDFQKYGQMGCGGKYSSYIFFLTFHIIYSLILMSTMIAIIFDAYSEVRREQQAMVNKFQLMEVKQEWKSYDSDATGYISYRDFWMFTAKLVKIYGADKQQILNQDTKQSFLKSLSIPIYEHPSGILCFQFHQVIQALTKLVFSRKNGQGLTKNADKMFNENLNTEVSGQKLKRSYYDSSHVLTLIILKSGLRAWRKKSKSDSMQQAISLFATAKIKQKIDHQKQQKQKQIKQRQRQEQRRKRRRMATGNVIQEKQDDQDEKCDKQLNEQEKQQQSEMLAMNVENNISMYMNKHNKNK